MRFNSCELKQLATDTSVDCTKEGILRLREKEGKLWNKTDGRLLCSMCSTPTLIGHVVSSLDRALYKNYLCLIASNKQQI